MRRAEFLDRAAATLRQRPLLAPMLVLLCLNAGFYAWTQGALPEVAWLSALADERAEPETNANSIHLLTPAEVVLLQARITLAQQEAQAEARAQATEHEMVLEFEPAPKPPKPPVKAKQPIIKLRLKNQRG